MALERERALVVEFRGFTKKRATRSTLINYTRHFYTKHSSSSSFQVSSSSSSLLFGHARHEPPIPRIMDNNLCKGLRKLGSPLAMRALMLVTSCCNTRGTCC